MTTYFVTINSVESEFTNAYAAYKALSHAIYEDDDVVAVLSVSDSRGEVWNSRDNSNEDLDRFYLEELSLDFDLETMETVEGGFNGYPRGFAPTLTGFKNWEQAKEIADENGLCLVWLHRCNGWQNWERDNFASDPIDVTSCPSDLGYDYCTTETAKDFMASELMDASWEDYDDYDEIVDRIDHIKEICELLEDREDNQVVLYNLEPGSDPLLCDRYIISYGHDSHEYCLGAVAL